MTDGTTPDTLWAALGRVPEARDAVTAGLAMAREQGLAYEGALLQLIEARLTEDPEARRAVRAEAQNLLRRFGVVLEDLD